MNYISYRCLLTRLQRCSKLHVAFDEKPFHRKLSTTRRNPIVLFDSVPHRSSRIYKLASYSSSSSSSSTPSSPSSSSSVPLSITDPQSSPLNLTELNQEIEILSKAGVNLPSIEELSIPEIDITDFTVEATEIPETLLKATDVGLTSFLPPALVFSSLMAFHDQLSWVGSIVCAAVFSRVLVFPLMIRNQRNAGDISNTLKSMADSGEAFRAAKKSGDPTEIRLAAWNYHKTVQAQQKTIMKSILPTLGMAAVFSSNFFAIRAIANYPVASLKEGGFLWFSDLTASDPLFILPLLTSASLFITFKMSSEIPPDPRAESLMKFFPVLVCPLVFIGGTMFPAALNFYWLTNNLLTLSQTLLLRSKPVRKLLKIEPPMKLDDEYRKKIEMCSKEFSDVMAILQDDIRKRSKANLQARLDKLKSNDEQDSKKQ